MEIKNQKLKDSLKALTVRACEIYQEKLGNIEYMGYPNLLPLDEKIAGIPEFKECCRVMDADETISSYYGKFVLTGKMNVRIRNAHQSLIHFIQTYYMDYKGYTEESFDDTYLRFENYFYSNTIDFIDTVELFNFESSEDHIQLTDELSISRVAHSTELSIEEMSSYTAFSKSEFVLQRIYKRKKRFKDESNIAQNDEPSESNTKDDFDLVITALRIIKSGAVYRGSEIITQDQTLHPGSRIIHKHRDFLDNTAIGSKVTLNSKDVDRLKETVQFLIVSQSKKEFRVASSRLSLGMERRNPEDRIIDFMIGLEAIYLPDGNTELTFRICLRIAHILAEKADRQELYQFVKDMYKVRSNVVHGGNTKFDELDVKHLEELLRQSLQMWINDPSKFSKENFENIVLGLTEAEE